MKTFRFVSILFSCFFISAFLMTACSYDNHYSSENGENRSGVTQSSNSPGGKNPAGGSGGSGGANEPEAANGGCPKDCASEVCITKPDQPNIAQCISEADVLYVNARDENCDNGKEGTGTKNSPFCEIQKAVQEAVKTKKPYVSVKASYRDHARDSKKQDYSVVKISTGSVTMIGPWANRTLKQNEDPKDRQNFISFKDIAIVGYKENEVISLEVSGDANVTFDGFHFTGSVVCSSVNATLEIRHSLLQSKNLQALEGIDDKNKIISKDRVLASPCKKITLENSDIREAGRGKASIHIGDMTTYRIVNSIIAHSPTGVILEKNSAGVFEFNTVTVHDKKGVDCGDVGSKKMIKNSIVVKNNGGKGDDQFSKLCEFDAVVAGPNEMINDPKLIKKLPEFEVGDFRLQENSGQNKDCCINKAIPDPEVKIDFFENIRPKGGLPDIGFQEVE